MTTQPAFQSTPRPQLSLPVASLVLLGMLALVTGIYFQPGPGLAVAAMFILGFAVREQVTPTISRTR